MHKILSILIILVIIPAQSYSKDIADKEINDPAENLNRHIYNFNTAVDRSVLTPIIKTYRFIIPAPGRKIIHNITKNLTEPLVFLNAVLQGDIDHSFASFWRFTINSTYGLGGMFDIAEKTQLQYRKEDFGQTMGYHGVNSGPYIVLPFLGPSNARDTLGLIADALMNPFNYLLTEHAIIGSNIAKAVDAKDRTLDFSEEIDKNSLDPYATIRSLYFQKRHSDIKNKKNKTDPYHIF